MKVPKELKGQNSLVDNALDAVAPLAQRFHLGPIREADEVVARAVEEVAAARRVQVEKDARHDDDLFLQTSLEEVEAVRYSVGEALEIQPAFCIVPVSMRSGVAGGIPVAHVPVDL